MLRRIMTDAPRNTKPCLPRIGPAVYNVGTMRRLLLIGLAATCAAATAEAKPWKLKENCTFVPNEANDGDSFHVRWNTRRYIFRLYFVDTPETDTRIAERVAEQAACFGISEQAVLRLGKEAAKFTRAFLEKKPFTAHTKLSDAQGASKIDRDYAFVESDGRDLGEALVANGLARIYGMTIDPPFTTAKTYLWRLKTAERLAKEKKLGGWGIAETAAPGRPAPPAPGRAPVTEHDRILSRPLAVFSLAPPHQQVGVLQSGAQIRVLGAVSDTMLRIRFSGAENRVFEAQCRRADLGL